MLGRRELTAIYNSRPVEIGENAVILEVGADRREVPAEYIWIFAGGTAPKAFLEKIGIGFGSQDLAPAVRAEVESRSVAADPLAAEEGFIHRSPSSHSQAPTLRL